MFINNLLREQILISETKKEICQLQKEYKDYNYCTNIFNLVLNTIDKNPKKVIEQILGIEEGGLKIWVLDTLAFAAQRYIESGNYHIYRGVLNEEGKELLNFYDSIYERMLSMNISNIDQQFVKEWKEYIRDQVKILG